MPGIDPPRQLLTHHATAVFLDVESDELRHGVPGSSPRNLFLTLREGAGYLVHSPSDGDPREIHVVPGLAPSVEQRRAAASGSSQAFSLAVGPDGAVGLFSDGLYLCAEPDGRVTLSRQQFGAWERFKLADTQVAPVTKEPKSVATGPVPGRISMSQELVHVTIGYPRTPMMELLETSSLRHGCRFVSLPKHWGAKPFSLHSKVTILQSYLGSGDVDAGDVILFTDAYDVVLAEHASIVLEKFLATRADIVFSAEANFYPTTPDGREPIKSQFDIYDSKWRYLNSGGYVGYAWAVKEMVDYCVRRIENKDYDTRDRNDQPLVQEFFLQSRDSKICRAGLDTAPDIFLCLNSHIGEFVIDRARVRHRQSGRSISVLHANGSKENLPALPRYWSLASGGTGCAGERDLRVASVDGRVLAYNAARRKLVQSDFSDPEIVVFLVKGNRVAIALNSGHGMLTFAPNGLVTTGAKVVNVWEVLNWRETVTTFHNTTLEPYCELGDGQKVSVGSPLLQFLQRPLVDNLLELITRYETRL